MTYRGRMKNGSVVLEPGATLPEATGVWVQPVEEPPRDDNEPGPSVWQRLLELSGSAQGLPDDLPQRHDHYRRKHNRLPQAQIVPADESLLERGTSGAAARPAF